MDDDTIRRAIEEESEGGAIPCARALDLARRLGVAPRRIGSLANELGIRITDCQLGCFGGGASPLPEAGSTGSGPAGA